MGDHPDPTVTADLVYLLHSLKIVDYPELRQTAYDLLESKSDPTAKTDLQTALDIMLKRLKR